MRKILKILGEGFFVAALVIAIIVSYVAGYFKGSSTTSQIAQDQIKTTVAEEKSSMVTINKGEVPVKVSTPTPAARP
ncbi:hypothetical protein ACFL1Q_03000, partial [Patescibacteria group bacterium]